MSAAAKRWWLVIALLLSVGVNVGVLSILAIQRSHGPRHAKRSVVRSATPFEKAADRLHLQGDKRQRFIVIHRTFFAQTRKAQARMEVLRRQLRRELSAGHPDEEKIERIVTTMGGHYAELDRMVVKTVLESRAILNRRQEQAYLKMLSRLRAAAMRRPGEQNRARNPQRRPGERF